MVARVMAAVRTRLGEAEATFRCCDSVFEAVAAGPRAGAAVGRARLRARELEARLNAFDPASAVAELNETGSVDDPHVAALVRRGLEYAERTAGAFDVRRGTTEHATKAYLRGETDAPPAAAGRPASVSVDATRVEADGPVDLNGLAKGYVVDRAAEALAGAGRRGHVNGGGDIAHPSGPVAVESPYGDDLPLAVLETDWHVASSAGYRRHRGEVDHLYDPATGEPGARHDLVTVVAERDCTEADALATALAVSPLDRGLSLVDGWPGAEALVVHAGVLHRSSGFAAHEHRSAGGGRAA